MDPYWKDYNMARARFGLDADLDPQQLALATQTNDKNICSKMTPFVVSLKRRDANGAFYAVGTGFFAMKEKPFIVTAAHNLKSTIDEVFFWDGSSSQACVLATDDTIDVAILRVNRVCTFPSLRHISAIMGETVYILGFPEGLNSTLNFTKGIVSSTYQGGFTTTAYADHGFSGGPVFSISMELLGMVCGGAGFVQGVTNQQVRCLDSSFIEGYVRGIMSVQPSAGNMP